MELTYRQKSERMKLNLPCFADGFGNGAIGYCFNGEIWQWNFGTDKIGESFECSDEFIEKVVNKNKTYISIEWNKNNN